MEKVNKINIEDFKSFLFNTFSSQIIYYEEFKRNLHFVEIDCFSSDSEYKLAIEISNEDVKFSVLSKEPSIDFSLYDYVKVTNFDAEEFIKDVIKNGWLGSVSD